MHESTRRKINRSRLLVLSCMLGSVVGGVLTGMYVPTEHRVSTRRYATVTHFYGLVIGAIGGGIYGSMYLLLSPRCHPTNRDSENPNVCD